MDNTVGVGGGGIKRTKSHDGHTHPRSLQQNRAHSHRHHTSKGGAQKGTTQNGGPFVSSLQQPVQQYEDKDLIAVNSSSITLDSGLGNSSPENGLALEDSLTEKASNEEDPLIGTSNNNGETISLNGDNTEQVLQETDSEDNAKEKTNRLIYSRVSHTLISVVTNFCQLQEELLSLKDCTRSLLTPQGFFDSIENEIIKEILK